MNKIFKSIRTLIFLSFLTQGCMTAFNLGEHAEKAEVITALARGPLAMLSHQYHNDYSKKAKFIHVATDLTRLANTVLSMINHQDDLYHASFALIFFDIGNLIRDLKAKNVLLEGQYSDLDLDLDLDENINAQTEQNTENNFDKKLASLNQIINASQKYFLPFVESTTALLVATNTEQTPQARLDRRRIRAACSLARALSVFSNHRKSIPAIALLLGAVTEMILVIQEMREDQGVCDNTYENAFSPEALENLANDLRQQNQSGRNDQNIRAIERRINQLRGPQQNR